LDRAYFLVAGAAALLSNCGNDSAGPADGSTGTEPDAAVCVAPGDPFSVGISKTSPEGGVTIVIDDANPAPPGIGKNEWKIRIKDAANNPIAGAVVNVALYMPPPHDHSMTGTDGADQGGGSYGVAGLNFTMPGLVYITLAVTSGGRTEKVQFQFCVRRKGN
jgi:hypothetical protein